MSTTDRYTSVCGTAGAVWPTPIRHLLALTGPTGFGSSSTAEQVTGSFDGTGKVAIVTGAGGGLGLETTRVLALRGVEVIMAVRNTTAAEEAAAAIRKAQPNAKICVMQLDLSSLASARAFVAAFLATGKQLNILINNGAVMACPFQLSVDGHELQFATNHLGHFVVTTGLLSHMLEVAKKQKVQARIIVVASSGHAQMGYKDTPIRFGELDDPKRYEAWSAYGQAKLANVLMARELAARVKGEPIAVASLHPGAIVTSLSRSVEEGLPAPVKWLMRNSFNLFMKSIPQGAATQVYLATAPEIISGEYYGDVNLSPSSGPAHDAVLGRKLWAETEKIVAA